MIETALKLYAMGHRRGVERGRHEKLCEIQRALEI